MRLLKLPRLLLLFGRRANNYDNYELDVTKPIDMQQWFDHQQKLISLIYPAIAEQND